jgi:hypothetical protein
MSKQIVARCFLNQLIPLELDSVFPSPPTEGENIRLRRGMERTNRSIISLCHEEPRNLTVW